MGHDDFVLQQRLHRAPKLLKGRLSLNHGRGNAVDRNIHAVKPLARIDQPYMLGRYYTVSNLDKSQGAGAGAARVRGLKVNRSKIHW
ncbi:hypothetical protein D3C81_1754490 [compost metagenome]